MELTELFLLRLVFFYLDCGASQLTVVVGGAQAPLHHKKKLELSLTLTLLSNR
jgi:hypothetical protein